MAFFFFLICFEIASKADLKKKQVLWMNECPFIILLYKMLNVERAFFIMCIGCELLILIKYVICFRRKVLTVLKEKYW